MPHELVGNWDKGMAFDLHTVSSRYLGRDEAGRDRFDTAYTEMGRLVHDLKYNKQRASIPKILQILKIIRFVDRYDFIVPVPPSKPRAFQPVEEIALALGRQRGIPVLRGYLGKRPGARELKDVHEPEARARLLRETVYIRSRISAENKTVLLIDDLFRSGVTLRTCTCILKEQARARFVSVLTMTKTRSRR